MARTRVRFGRLGALLAAVLLTLVVVAQGASGRTEAGGGAGAVHVVEAGDTLWDIALAVVGEEGDPRPLVQDIRDANDMATSALEPGMRLVIPAG